MSYTASLRQNPGRTSWLVEFRHPGKFDKAGKKGRKVRKGLGDCSEEQARSLVEQLNVLLKDESLWSVDAKAIAELRFDSRVIEIFYDDLEFNPTRHRDIRQEYLPLPTINSSRILLLGRTGAGKTTLLRQLIGSDRFPSTSTNRTTTCEIEVIATEEDFSAVVTFMTEAEASFKVGELVSSAILEAIDGAEDTEIARVFLEDSEQRFRLKYILGDLRENKQEGKFQDRLKNFIQRIKEIAASKKEQIEKGKGNLSNLSPREKNEAFDLIQAEIEASDLFMNLVSAIIEEIRSKLSFAPSGEFDKSPTGWYKVWRLRGESDRKKFIEAIRYFSDNSRSLWGTLITPLVTGIRVRGSFFPEWSQHKHPVVLIDTEGLGHKASVESNLSNSIVGWFDQVDVILLVDKATDSMTHSVGRALETIEDTGHTQKLILSFTHVDALQLDDEDLSGLEEKKDHLYTNVRNMIKNQVRKTLSGDVARFMENHLRRNTFFLESLNATSNEVKLELQTMLERLINLPSPKSSTAFPEYNYDNLVLAIREGVEEFREQWKAILGLDSEPTIDPASWRSLKALTRRYSEGWNDGFHLNPTADLRTSLSKVISQFLDNSLDGNNQATFDDKRVATDRIKAKFTEKLIDWVEQQLWKKPYSQWCIAYRYRGQGSTLERSEEIESIYEHFTPIPSSTGNLEVQAFINEIKALVKDSINEVRREIDVVE